MSDADRPAPQPLSAEERGKFLSLAARMIRMEGGCETGHKPGQWHMHEDRYFRQAQQVAAFANRLLSAGRAAHDGTHRDGPSSPDPATCGHSALIDGDDNCPDCGAPVIYRERAAHDGEGLRKAAQAVVEAWSPAATYQQLKRIAGPIEALRAVIDEETP